MSMLLVEYPSDRTGHRAERQVYRKIGKPALDAFFVLLALPVALPLIGLAALALLIEGGKPFYWQDRIGRNGRVFRMMKLRTMVQNADQLLETYLDANPEARQEWDEKQKLENDPRVTRLGYILRKSSLDELPQLWNVFKGEMSIVGPRPMMVDQRDLYHGDDYYTLRPGITGLWQVSRRNTTSFASRARFDAIYSRNISLRTDFKILTQTVSVVLRATGC